MEPLGDNFTIPAISLYICMSVICIWNANSTISTKSNVNIICSSNFLYICGLRLVSFVSEQRIEPLKVQFYDPSNQPPCEMWNDNSTIYTKSNGKYMICSIEFLDICGLRLVSFVSWSIVLSPQGTIFWSQLSASIFECLWPACEMT
jgi:hypothetical protein